MTDEAEHKPGPYCDECEHPRKCNRRKCCVGELEAFAAWSPDGMADPYYEIRRQMEKDD